MKPTRIDLDLAPGRSLGPFQLGSLLFNVLNHVRSYRHAYPNATLAWDDDNPSSSLIYLTLSAPPVHLSFDPASQRLSRIEVSPALSLSSDPALTAGSYVSYRGKTLRDDREETEDVVRTVRRVLGPTSGSSKVTDDDEMLTYPGVAFGVSDRGSRLNRIILTPLPTPHTASVDKAWLHPILPPSPTIATGDLRLAQISLDAFTQRPTTVTLHFHSSREDPIEPVVLEIGHTTSEDVLCDLGSAVRSFWKEDERMSIHTVTASSSVRDPALELNPYFLSYPHLGLTLMLEPPSTSTSTPHSTHVLSKIILHSNLPGQINFGRTSRCTWSLTTTTTTSSIDNDNDDHDQDDAADDDSNPTVVLGEAKFVEIKSALKRESQTLTRATTTTEPTAPVAIYSPSSTVTSCSTSGENSHPATATATGTTNAKKKKNKDKGPSTKSLPPVLTELEVLGDPCDDPHDPAPSSSSGRGGGKGGGGLGDSSRRPGEAAESLADEQPMILDRTAAIGGDEGFSGLRRGTTNGRRGGDSDIAREHGIKGRTTEIHGFPGIAFEVTTSGDVETVWLF